MAGMLNESQLVAVSGTWDVISTSLGGVPNVVVFAFMRQERLDVAVAAARIAPTGASEARGLTAVEAVQLALIWRWSRQKVGMSGEGAVQSQEPGVLRRRGCCLVREGQAQHRHGSNRRNRST